MVLLTILYSSIKTEAALNILGSCMQDVESKLAYLFYRYRIITLGQYSELTRSIPAHGTVYIYLYISISKSISKLLKNCP
jgi:hypothetical protein